MNKSKESLFFWVFKKKKRVKNCESQVFLRKQSKSKNHWFWYLKTLKEPAVFWVVI
jgi:sulfur transfer protein SufE